MGKKRKSEEKKLQRYLKKIRKMEKRLAKRVELNSDETSSDHYSSNSDEELTPNLDIIESSSSTAQVPVTTAQSSLSPDILMALGDPMPVQPKFGPNICEEVAGIMNNILKNGLKKESKCTLMEELIPENCPLLIAPKINLEVATAVGENIRNRDKKIEFEQNQLGVALSVLSQILSSLIVNENIDRLHVVSSLSNAVRILADLHAIQTRARKNLTLPALDKQFLNLVKDVERDEYLFGTNLNEKIQAIKNSQKSGNSIKKIIPNPKQGNYSGPSRYQQNGTRSVTRGGPQKYPVVRNYQQKFQRKPNPEQYRQSAQLKPRVPGPK